MPNRLSPAEQSKRNRNFANGLLFCRSCKKFLPVKNFYRDNTTQGKKNYGYRFYCKNCESHKRNKKWARQYHKEKNQEKRVQLIELMGGCCQYPGCDYSTPRVLQLHHVTPDEKKFNVKSKVYSGLTREVLEEADKCCLLCANHHFEHESELWDAIFIKRDGIGYTISKVVDCGTIKKAKKTKSDPVQLGLILENITEHLPIQESLPFPERTNNR